MNYAEGFAISCAKKLELGHMQLDWIDNIDYFSRRERNHSLHDFSHARAESPRKMMSNEWGGGEKVYFPMTVGGEEDREEEEMGEVQSLLN
jgi:hypothetical protein